MAETCCGEGNEVMILACSGGSNVGQLSNQAAVELTQEGFGKMFCLAGIGGRLSGFVQSAKDTPKMVAVDGCPVGCAKAILKEADIPMDSYLVITEEKIEKNKNFNLERTDVDRVKAAVKTAVNGAGRPLASSSEAVGGCKSCC